MYQFKLTVERGNVRVQCIFTQETSTVILASMQPSMNDERQKTQDHANRKATKHSPESIAVWGDE